MNGNKQTNKYILPDSIGELYHVVAVAVAAAAVAVYI